MATASLVRPIEEIAFRHILIATDFSESSRCTLAYAGALAQKYGSEILLVHALTPSRHRPSPLPPVLQELDAVRNRADQELAKIAADPRLKDCPRRTMLEEGAVCDALDSVIAREGVDLLVLGTHGRGGLKKLILGSVAEEILRLAPCPTLTVGPHASLPERETACFRTILYVTDFGTAASAAFPYALALSEDCEAKLILLHVMEPLSVLDVGPAAYGPGDYAAKEIVEWRERAQAENLNRLKQVLPRGVKLASEPEYVIDRNFLPDGIIAVAASHSVDLIVMGVASGHSARLAAHRPGEPLHAVICEAKCPVLTVRG